MTYMGIFEKARGLFRMRKMPRVISFNYGSQTGFRNEESFGVLDFCALKRDDWLDAI